MATARQPNEPWSSRSHVFPPEQPPRPEPEKMAAAPAENPEKPAEKLHSRKVKSIRH